MSPQIETKKETKRQKSKGAKIASALNEKQNILGVEFAPINVPLERRLQTLSVLTWIMLFFVSGPLSVPILVYMLFYTRLWIFVVLYLAWVYLDRETCERGGRRIDWVRKWRMWYHYRNYFPITLVKTCDLDPKRNYLFCSHPHGILSSGIFSSFITEGSEVSKVFPGLTIYGITLKLNFMIPLFREWCLALGLCSAQKESMSYLLSHPDGGKGVVLVPGGAPEALESHPGSYVIQLTRRKGFIKLALQNGSSLVPVFSFGETEIYRQAIDNPEGSFVRKIQDKITSLLTFAPVLFVGRGIFQYSFGILPQRRPIFVAVGAPIHLQKIEKPTQEDVDNLHEKYVKALSDLFYAHRNEFADPSHEFKIV